MLILRLFSFGFFDLEYSLKSNITPHEENVY